MVFFLILASLFGLARFEGGLERWNTLVYDNWIRLSARPVPSDVVIVAVDAESIEDYGRWPWSRSRQARLIQNIASADPRIIGVDVIYAEPDHDHPEDDVALAKALSESGNTVLPISIEPGERSLVMGETLPIPALQSSARALGHVHVAFDSGGMVRNIHLKMGFRNAHWSSLSLAMLEAMDVDIALPPSNEQPLQEGYQKQLDWRSNRQFLIPYYGPPGSFTYVSAHEVLSDNFDPASLKDKVVFVGATALGLGDSRSTPVSKQIAMPGVEIHANVFSALRDKHVLSALPEYQLHLIFAGLLAVLLLAYPRLKQRWVFVIASCFTLFPIFLSYSLFTFFLIWLPPLEMSVFLLLSLVLWSWHRLEFAARFLANEVERLRVDSTLMQFDQSGSLSECMKGAMHHMPLDGWIIVYPGHIEEGGQYNDIQLHNVAGAWSSTEGAYCRSYTKDQSLLVGFSTSDPDFGQKFCLVVDALVKQYLSDQHIDERRSVERLQHRADDVSHARMKLQQLAAFTESIFQGTPAGLFVWNIFGELVALNPEAKLLAKKFALPSQDAKLQEMLLALNVEQDCSITDLLLNGKELQFDYRLDDLEMLCALSVVGDELRDRFVLMSVVDSTEVRRRERERSELVDYLSHDLRSPLTSALSIIQLEKRKAELPDGYRNIERYIETGLKLVNDLLQLARADNLNTHDFTELLFDNLLDTAYEQLWPQIQTRNISVEIDIQDEELWVNANGQMIERVLINILDNALKYSYEGGRIDITATQKEGELLCCFRDFGVGVTDAQADLLFQRFKRVGDVNKNASGIGLGLAFVSSVVMQHGGRVWAEKGLSEGACICLALPLIMLEE